MKKFMIRYGVIGGTVAITLGLLNWFLIAKPLGYAASQWIGYLSIIIGLLCIPLGIKYFRDKLNGGIVSFKQGFKIGMGITFMAALVMAIYSAIYFVVGLDDFVEWRNASLGEDATPLPDIALTPWFQGLVMFVTAMLIGLIINLLSALALKKEIQPSTH